MNEQQDITTFNEKGVHERAQTTVYHGGRSGVLMLHGFGGSPDDLRETARALQQEGFSVVNARIAGHGTTPEDLEQRTAADWQASARAGLNLLRKEADEIFLFGFSFGGSLAIDLLLDEPFSIRGLILVGMPIWTAGERKNRFLLPFARLVGKRFARKRWVKTAKVAAEYRAAGKYLVTPIAAFARMLEFIDRNTKAQLKRVRVPTLMLYSKDDYATDPRSADYCYTHLGTEEKELYWVPLESKVHHVLKSRKRSAALEKIRDFLARYRTR